MDEDIDQCESAMSSLARHIYDAQGEVIRILEDAEKTMDSSETRRKLEISDREEGRRMEWYLYTRKLNVAVDMEELLEYGRRLANFTSAPPGYDPQAPTAAGTIVRPPFPSEQQMKSGWMRGSLDAADESLGK